MYLIIDCKSLKKKKITAVIGIGIFSIICITPNFGQIRFTERNYLSFLLLVLKFNLPTTLYVFYPMSEVFPLHTD